MTFAPRFEFRRNNEATAVDGYPNATALQVPRPRSLTAPPGWSKLRDLAQRLG